MIVRITAAILAVCLTLTGCASIVSFFNDPGRISISSSPEQAELIITDEKGKEVFRGKTPYTVTLETFGGYFRGKRYMVHVFKEGFREQNFIVKKGLNRWYLGNIVIVSVLGLLIIDPLTGDMWKLSPKDIHVPLGQKSSETEAINSY
jgi:hypothetical protein